MPHFKHNDIAGQIKTIHNLEAIICNLHKAIAALPPRCDCLASDEDTLKQALAEEINAVWEQDFQEELRTGIRASIDWMDPSKRKSANGQ